MQNDEKAFVRSRLIAISLSLLVGTGLMALKFYVYSLTQSSAILSDALESIINVVASAFALGSIVFAAKPPDPSHPYGHGKIEYFSAGFEGALIVLAAIGIVQAAWPQILYPHELPNLQSGLLLLLGASAINLILGVGLIRAGKRTRSLVLIADGRHVLTDVYTSAGVLLGLFLVHQTGWYWLDGAIAVLVGVNILVIGFKLIREAFQGLMDASDPKLLEEISLLISAHRKDTWIDIHNLRAMRSGNRVYVDFHLILPRNLTLEKAHDEVSEIQDLLRTQLPGMADALIHAEPCVDPECPICGYHPCMLRREQARQQSLWHRDTLTGHQKRQEERLRRRRKKDGSSHEPKDHRRTRMRIVVMGQAAFGAKTLEVLLEKGENVVGVYTPLEKAGARPDPIKETAIARGIPVYQPTSYKTDETFAQYRELAPDLTILAFVTDIIPQRYFDAATQGAICYHPSILPRHRGSSAINWALIMGDTRTGLTIFWPDGGIDTGPILLQKEVDIKPEDTTGSIYFNHLFPMGVDAILESIALIKDNKAPRIAQDSAGATYEPPCTDHFASVDWKKPAHEIYNLVRGCDPQPGAFSTWGGQKLRFYAAGLQEGSPSGTPGSIVQIDKAGIHVAAGSGGVIVAGKVRGSKGGKVSGAEWAAENGLKVGDRFADTA